MHMVAMVVALLFWQTKTHRIFGTTRGGPSTTYASESRMKYCEMIADDLTWQKPSQDTIRLPTVIVAKGLSFGEMKC